MSKERAPWPQCYYDELDARKRKDLLDKAIENGEGAPEENAVRQKLWALRYGQPKKNMPPADGYAGLWITMNLWRRDTASRFRVRAAVKELSGMLKQLGIDAPQASSLEQELVYRELVHAVRLYLSTCTEGSYNTRFLGMVRLKPEQLVDKIVNEICGVAYELPERLGMEEQFAPLRRAAYEAFSAAYPEQVGKLDSAIFDSCVYQKEHLLLAVPGAFAVNGKLQEYAVPAREIRRGKLSESEIPPVPLEYFRDEPFALLKPDNDTRKRAMNLCRLHGFEPRMIFELDQQQTAYHVTCSGLGVSFVSDTLIIYGGANPGVVYYRLDGADSFRDLFFYWKKGRYFSRAMGEFLKTAGCEREKPGRR